MMRRWLSTLILTLSWCACALAAAQAVPPRVAAALAQARVPVDAVALLALDLGTGKPLLRHRADVAMNPASVMKLVTTFAALDLLGPAHVWKTPLVADGELRDGILHGNLYLVGSGDPKLVVERVWLLLQRLQALGVRQIAGDIVLDSSVFTVEPVDPARFDGEPLRAYNVAPDGLLLNFKAITLYFSPDGARQRALVSLEPALWGVQVPASVPLLAGDCNDYRASLQADFSDPQRLRFGGGLPAACGARTWVLAYADPVSYGARLVRALWEGQGGTLLGTVRAGTAPAALRTVPPLAETVSAPLADIVRDINKFSNNVMAQQLFLTLGQGATPAAPAPPGSLAAARAVTLDWWRQRLPDAATPVLDNGSGLSRQERATAQALGQLLQRAWDSPLMPDFVASLPLSGVDGTLRRSAMRATAHLKTGSLADVAALAGYVHARNGQRRAVVALVNHAQARQARPALDAFVEWTQQQP